MKANPPRTLIGVLFFTLLCGVSILPSRTAAQSQEGVEELTRGPVHEAFATSVSYEPEAGIIIDRQPPELIEELPPEQRPVGTNVSWISGYWAWDDDRSDFIWVSGIWRNLPPGRQWIPGYWAPADSRWQWTSGYWGEEDRDEVTYLPPPPKALENGPNSDAPSRNHIWVSGNWMYNSNRYAWRPGYWEPAQENWVWIPAHYQWTRRGYVYIEGYWDYDVDRRGMVFAPVHFGRSVYSRPDYYYTPSTVIVVNVFLHHLFVRPHYSHYYFGDYYAPRYRDLGVYASFNYHTSRRGYDPFYAHDLWRHRDDRDWDRRRRDDFEFYRDNEAARPPQTLAALMRLPEEQRRGRRDDFQLAQPLSRLVSDTGATSRRFQALDKGDRDRFVSQNKEVRKFSRDREQREIRSNERAGEDAKSARVVREKFTRSPLVAKRAEQLSGDDAPPPRRAARNDERDQRPGNRDADGASKPGAAVMPDRRETPKGGDDRGPDGRPSREREAGGDSKPGTAVMPDRKENPKGGDDRGPDGRPSREREAGGDSKPGTAVMPDRKENTKDNEDRRPGERRENPSMERKENPPAPAPDRKEPEGRRPQVTPAPEREVERKRPVPEIRKEAERKAAPTPQPQRKIEPQPQRKAEPQRRQEPQIQRKAEPQRRQEAQVQRKAEPQRRQEPQVQRRAEPQQRPAAAPAPRKQEASPRPQQAPPQPRAAEAPKRSQPAAPKGGGGGEKEKDRKDR